MNGAGSARLILGLALLLGGIVTAPCTAQPPAAVVPAPTGSAAPGAGRDLRSAPPSTVSPAIERFLRESGRDLSTATTTASNTSSTLIRPPLPPLPVPRPQIVAHMSEERRQSDPPLSLPPLPADPANPLRGVSSPAVSPLSEAKMKPAPFEPSDRRFPINLATALRLSDARPLIVAAAQAGVWIAEAELTRANVLWVPTFMFGADYLRHDGGGPDFNKGIMTAPSTNYFIAGGSADLYVNLTDAIFEPLVARQVLNARNWDIQSAKNDALLQTADAYFRAHQYRGMYAGAIYTVERAQLLVDRITALSKELVPKDEVDRVLNMLAELKQRAVLARQEWRVASADLTQVLRLDPRAVVEPLEHDHAQITLIDPGRSLDDLISVALVNRPEVSSRRASVQAAESRIRREKARPLLPLVAVNGFQTPGMLLQGGIFGLGPNSSLNQWRGRTDVSFQLMWQLESFGIGNLARIKNQRGAQSQAVIDLRNTQDTVAADVMRALSRVQSAAARVLQADRSLRNGIVSFNGHLEGLQQTRRFGNVLVLTFRPQEAVYSLELLNDAFNEYFTTVAEYNRAQFELFHALGYPAREVASLRTAGTLLPIDTRRPSYLPPVANGPPPATR
jgi:outer membrane protein TolC